MTNAHLYIYFFNFAYLTNAIFALLDKRISMKILVCLFFTIGQIQTPGQLCSTASWILEYGHRQLDKLGSVSLLQCLQKRE